MFSQYVNVACLFVSLVVAHTAILYLPSLCLSPEIGITYITLAHLQVAGVTLNHYWQHFWCKLLVHSGCSPNVPDWAQI
jgi:hypothetical protein